MASDRPSFISQLCFGSIEEDLIEEVVRIIGYGPVAHFYATRGARAGRS